MKLDEIKVNKLDDIRENSIILCDTIITNEDSIIIEKEAIDVSTFASKDTVKQVLEQHVVIVKALKEITKRLNIIEEKLEQSNNSDNISVDLLHKEINELKTTLSMNILEV